MSKLSRRISLLVLSMTAAVLAPFAGLSPASAAPVECTTSTLLTAKASTAYVGSSLPASFDINASCPGVSGSGFPPAGTVSIQRLRAGGTVWETAASQALNRYTSVISLPVTIDGTAYFKLVYSGGTYTSGSTTLHFAAAESSMIGVTAQRSVSVTSKKVRGSKPIPVTWTANPAARGVVYLKKKGKRTKWKVAKRVTVSTGGTHFKLRAKPGTKVRFVIPGNASIATFDWTTKIKRTSF